MLKFRLKINYQERTNETFFSDQAPDLDPVADLKIVFQGTVKRSLTWVLKKLG
jgi:hypothetical protein